MASYEKIRFEVKNRLAHIILNNPPQNLLTHQMLCELEEAADWLAGQINLMAVIFSASGASFSSGLDFSEHSSEFIFSITERFRFISRSLLDLEWPTIAVVDGKVKNWGCDLLFFFDIVLAGANASFQYDNLSFGTFPPIGMIFLLEKLGYKETFKELVEGAEFSASRAAELDMVSLICPKEQLVAELKKTVASLNKRSASVMRIFLKNLRRRKSQLLDVYSDDIFSDYLNLLTDLNDYEEGIRAWIEKRMPSWKDF